MEQNRNINLATLGSYAIHRDHKTSQARGSRTPQSPDGPLPKPVMNMNSARPVSGVVEGGWGGGGGGW